MMNRNLALAASVLLTLSACGPDDESPQYGDANNVNEFSPIEAPPADSWPTFRADPQRTGHSPMATTKSSGVTEVWRIEAINTTEYGAAKGSPSVWGDTLYIGSDDARFTAVNAETGELKWETSIDDTTNGIHGTPTIGPDMVYIGAYNGTVHAYDRATGEEQWKYKKGFQIGSSPVLVPEHGRIYTAHEDSSRGGGWVTSIDARTGKEFWSYRFGAHAHSSVALDLEKNLIFVGDNAAIMRGWDAITGEDIWKYQLEQTDEDQADIKTTPTVLQDRGLVVAGAWSRKVHAWDVETGEIAWEYETGGSRIMGSTAYAPGRGVVYVGSLASDQSVHAIDADDGSGIWSTKLGGSIMSSPAINGDESVIVIGSHDGNVYGLSAEDGEILWQHEIGGKVSSSPTLVGDMVYVAAANGDLVALKTE